MVRITSKPVADFIAANNAFDGDAMLATFTEDALVNDMQRELVGKPAIRAWVGREIVGAKVTVEAIEVRHHHGDEIVTFKIDGDYDKTGLPDPLLLTYYFSLHDDKISRLIILRNKLARDVERKPAEPAYFIYVCQKVIDRKELETYWAKVGPTLAGYQAKNIAAYTLFEQLEGEPVDGVAVVEFPSVELAKAWYNSPAYGAVRSHRQRGARYIGLLAEGGSLPPELRMPHTKR